MKPQQKKHSAVVHSFLDRRRDAIIARGSFAPVFSAYLEHAERWAALPPDAGLPMMAAMLAASTLDLALRPPDEFAAWTLNVKDPPLNLFYCGDNSEFIVTGRAFTRDVQTFASSRLFVESQSPRRRPSRSSVDVEGTNVLAIYEQYCQRSEQLPSRYFEISPNEFLLVRGLPRVDRAWLDHLDSAAASGILGPGLELIDRRYYRFRCGCNRKAILGLIQGMYRHQAEELFLGEPRVEASCPRCGRRFWIGRREFGVGPGRMGIS